MTNWRLRGPQRLRTCRELDQDGVFVTFAFVAVRAASTSKKAYLTNAEKAFIHKICSEDDCTLKSMLSYEFYSFVTPASLVLVLNSILALKVWANATLFPDLGCLHPRGRHMAVSCGRCQQPLKCRFERGDPGPRSLCHFLFLTDCPQLQYLPCKRMCSVDAEDLNFRWNLSSLIFYCVLCCLRSLIEKALNGTMESGDFFLSLKKKGGQLTFYWCIIHIP